MSYYASQVHQKAYDLAVAWFEDRFKTYRKTPMLQVTPQDLPILAVHILRERREQDGQNNEGEPKFKHQLTLGFSGAVHGETPNQDQLYALEQTMSELDELLLSSSQFVNQTEAIISMDRLAQYTKVGETTLFEIRVEMVCEFSSYWPPRVVDDFNTMHVTTEFPDKAHADAGTPQIEREYTLDQNS
jgi:hypothetical protein